MEARTKERLIEAAHLTFNEPGFVVEVVITGISITYTWGSESRGWQRLESSVTWEELENAKKDPLVLAIVSLTKQAGSFQ